jgi:hypothetical protein
VGSCTSLGQQQKKGASVLRWLASAKLRGLGVGAIALIRAMVRWQNNNENDSGLGATYRSREDWISTCS